MKPAGEAGAEGPVSIDARARADAGARAQAEAAAGTQVEAAAGMQAHAAAGTAADATDEVPANAAAWMPADAAGAGAADVMAGFEVDAAAAAQAAAGATAVPRTEPGAGAALRCEMQTTRGRTAWLALAALLAGGAVAVAFATAASGVRPVALDWQPGLAWREPWRAWSAAWLHFSALHVGANLAGCALVAALGVAARVPARSAAAWLAAWPLTQLGLLARPDLLHYGGLSGVLHAGVAVCALHLALDARGARRRIGLAMLLVLSAKVASETPWSAALRQPAGWDIAVAPFAHLSGLLAGLGTAGVAELARRWPAATRGDT